MGEVEQSVMDYIWSHGPCTAESCREALASSRPMKDSTIRTVLRRLEEKGYLAHDIDGNDLIAQRIRFVANRALGLYETSEVPRAQSAVDPQRSDA